jgi:hypothetical protein
MSGMPRSQDMGFRVHYVTGASTCTERLGR